MTEIKKQRAQKNTIKRKLKFSDYKNCLQAVQIKNSPFSKK